MPVLTHCSLAAFGNIETTLSGCASRAAGLLTESAVARIFAACHRLHARSPHDPRQLLADVAVCSLSHDVRCKAALSPEFLSALGLPSIALRQLLHLPSSHVGLNTPQFFAHIAMESLAACAQVLPAPALLRAHRCRAIGGGSRCVDEVSVRRPCCGDGWLSGWNHDDASLQKY